MSGQTPKGTQWYVLRSKPRKEFALWRQLEARNVRYFFPFVRVTPVNPRSRTLRPYFPGYLFLRVDLEQVGLSVFNRMPHAVGLVSFGGVPARVPENFIDALRQRLAAIDEAGGEIFFDLDQGDPVWITDGPFEGYRALFDARLPGKERVRVLLELLSDQLVPLELSSGHIEKVAPRQRLDRGLRLRATG